MITSPLHPLRPPVWGRIALEDLEELSHLQAERRFRLTPMRGAEVHPDLGGDQLLLVDELLALARFALIARAVIEQHPRKSCARMISHADLVAGGMMSLDQIRVLK